MTSSRFWWPRRTTRQQELPNGGIITSSGPSLPYTSISNSNSSINDEKNIDREPILSSSPWSYSGITSAPSVSYYDSYLSWSMSKWKRKILTILHFVILALACLGCYDLIQFNKGYYMKTPVYSKYQLSQAGYLRREQQQYSQYGSTKNLPPSLEEGYSSITSNHGNGQDERPLSSSSSSSSSYRTPVTSWTFPSFFQNEANPASSSSLGLVAGAHHTNSHNSSSTHISATISPSVTSNKASDQHLLILSPIRNAAHLLPTFFNNLEKLTHPKMNTSIGILLSDEEDETGSIVQDWVNLQSIKNEYRHITLLRKDFGLIMPSGKARHEDWVQTQRRSIMARARSLLLVSTLEPSVDWVFWLDVDVKEIPSTIIADLLRYGGVGAETRENDKNNLVSSSPTTSQYTTPSIVSGQEGQEEVDGKDSDQITTETQDNLDGSIKGDHNDDIVDHSIMKRGTYSKKEKKSKTKTKNQNQRQKQISNHDMSHVPADVIAPNIMNRHKGRVQPYDRNNWAETFKSEQIKAALDPDFILHEGDKDHPTYRLHLADQWVPPNVTLDPFLPMYTSESQSQPSQLSSSSSNLYDPTSKAYIGRQIQLDAVGGVATLVRASVHLFGGVFPSWNVDHAVETEGFGKMAKLIGARVIGLPNYIVLHR